MQKFSSFGRKKKNRPKFDIEWICPKTFNCKTDLIPSTVGRNISCQMSGKDCCSRRLEAATISEILHLSGQGNLTFITEGSGKSQGILKTDVCGNHAIGDKLLVFSDKIVHIWISSQKPRVCQKPGGNPGVNARQSSQLVLLPKQKRRHSRQESS